ncbi:MAG: hydroxymethylbilane synthase [Kiloniellaceae bacterium]
MTVRALLRLGTRGSPLALAQTREVRRRLAEARPELAGEDAVEIVVIKTTGDRVQERTLAEIGGKGLFTKEIEEALLDGRIDAAVHSMKDMPTWLPEGLGIAAILPREDPRDAFFSPHGASLADLPAGAVVGTASLRRQAQALLARPDLGVVPLRGNVETRLRKLSEGRVDATLLAVAGLRRLGMAARITAVLAPEEMLPAVAQGAIGVEARRDDARTHGWIAALNDAQSERRVAAERACLAALDGSCRTPIAALAETEDGGAALRLRALVCMPDGTRAHRAERRGPAREAERLGREAGEELRAAAGPAFFAALAAS